MAQLMATSRALEEEEMTEEERELLLFTKELEEFMVVPELEDSPIRLEDLLSEANISGLTVDSLQNPSGVFVVDVDRTSSDHNAVGNAFGNGSASNFVSGNQGQFPQYQHYQQHQQISYTSPNFNKAFDGASTGVMASGFYHSSTASPQVPQQQISELSDPTANWVAQTADVTLLEDILDIVPQGQQAQPVQYQPTMGSPVLDKKQILEEIYREAEEISSRNGSPATTPEISNHGFSSEAADLWERITDNSSTFSSSGDDSMDSYQPALLAKNFDHSFGVGSIKKQQSKTTKRPQTKRSTGQSSTSESSIEVQPKKAKKRHQNREAALRYRLKKRAERTATSEELNALLERNEFLKSQKSSIESEIAYLKGLLSEVHKKTTLKRLV